MKKISLPLFWKFTIAIVAIVTLFGSINALLIWQNVTRSLEEELEKRGIFIAKSLASQSVEPLVYDDYVMLQKMLDDLKNRDDNVVYAFILNGDNEVVAHTFRTSVPEELIWANPLREIKTGNSVIIAPKDSSERTISDIAEPILDGKIGVVRIGIEERTIKQSVNKTITTLLTMVGVFLFVGIAGAFVFSYVITKPIKIISNAAEKIDLDSLATKTGDRIIARDKLLNTWKYLFRAEDELDLLTEKFNGMIERLEKTYGELRSTQISLIHSEKLASMGTIAAGIAHEINNPISGLQSCIRRISKNPENIIQNTRYLGLMKEAADRIEHVVKGLLNYSRKHDPVFVSANINNIIENSLMLVRHRIQKEKVTVLKNISPVLPEIYVSPNHLEQILINLLLNSIDAINERRSINPSAPAKIDLSAEADKSNMILSIADTGIGIEQENMAKLFDPFFTTKKNGSGTGLGLSVCHNIISQYKGEIVVESEYGSGSKFTLFFPIRQNGL